MSDLGVALTPGRVTGSYIVEIPANVNGLGTDGIPGNVNDFAVAEIWTN